MATNSYIIANDAAFKAWLKRASDTCKDLRIPFGLILADFYKSEQAIFKLSGPGKYPPFKKSVGSYMLRDGTRRFSTSEQSRYQAEKLKKHGFDYPLLVSSGKLAASMLGPNNPGSVSNIGPLSLIFGTSIKYGIYHQSDAPRKKIPLRKFIFIGPEAPTFATSDQVGRLTRWLNILNEYIMKTIQREAGA